ncbi:hypothetical protein [Novosphingobium album (ex Hu et al. 2023)]|uniref:Aminoglycoside phosphotransferase domain-containing protein n=1 Tax=Novosphingobium album (ex Hu et al. 2023) TaxID=2930093 RepID=A0ABT0B5S0_9SPHN|nr:hypothetical protein [Novosphingobium album (ex Hu et al. 2023)]MCJ2180411.1 hypothetical protein [Novosphingobium album (ex Hu et al. 2023)]
MTIPQPLPEPVFLDRAPGDATGVIIPAHGDALREDGAAWLTAAFRRFGSLGEDNHVARIDRFERCPGGSTGAKFLLDVEYARSAPGLHTALFVKFSRDFADRRRDHPGRYEMASEAPFMALARQPGFPVAVAEPLFADYEQATGTGIVITERIAFGQTVDGRTIEQHRAKTLDFQTMDDPLPYYRATVTALARLAGAHRAGRLSPDIDACFPWNPTTGSADAIRQGKAGLQAELAYARSFVERAPQHFPAPVRAPAFLDRLHSEAMMVLDRQQAVQAYLTGNPGMIALNHWNAHIDNAFFWREGAAVLRCGFIDWGRVGQITLGAALWGGLSAAHHAIWDDHLDDLLGLFVEEYRSGGGPTITAAELENHLMVHIAAMGVARVLAFPEIIAFRLPGIFEASGPRDPAVLAIEPARNCLHVLTVFLKLWEGRGLGERVARLG